MTTDIAYLQLPRQYRSNWEYIVRNTINVCIKRFTKRIESDYERFSDTDSGVRDDLEKYKEIAADMTNTALMNRILTDLELIPFAHLQYFYKSCRSQLRLNVAEARNHFIICLKHDIEKVRAFQQTYLWMVAKWNHKTTREEINKQLDDLIYNQAKIDRTLPKDEDKLKRLIRVELKPFLLHYPQTMTWNEIYAKFNEYYGEKRGLVYNKEVEAIINSGKSPWRTSNKLTNYGKRVGWDAEHIKKTNNKTARDSFNMKEQRKLMKHWCAPYKTFVLDYFYAGRYMYMLAINVNTRKLYYVLPDEIKKYGTGWITYDTKKPKASIKSAINSLKRLMELTEVRHLLFDNENAWTSATFHKFCDEHDITYRHEPKYDVRSIMETNNRERRSTHTVTALIDRAIRTIRLMNHNLGLRNEINPKVLEWIIDEYNNSPHSTLSKILKRQTTPNEVDNDKELEGRVVLAIRRMNFFNGAEDNEVHDSDVIRVFNNAHAFDKVKPKLLPGTWEFVERDGGLYKVKQGRVTITVPRWMLKQSGDDKRD